MAVYVSSEILEHISEAEAGRHARTRTYTCGACSAVSDASTEPGVAVLSVSPEMSQLSTVHERCVSPQVVRRCPSGSLGMSTGTDLVSRAITIPAPGGNRPALLLAWEESVTLLAPSPSADDVPFSPVQRFLIDQGLHRFFALGKRPPESPGWLVRQGPADALQIDGPGHRQLEDGRMTAPAAWRSLVAEAGEVTLLVGQLDHETLYANQPSWTAYGQALRGGRLVAGTVKVTLL
ncbi:hypothetical protein [Streptomyces sp. RK75]|uniref:hypothetical protein n=1 Tax=Streptomyces sp. RK75 TaxID=2824895 RepID=UPI001B372C19|nr:hypothetical protein [Streptomyces sp. RK75]MBQ0866877.1 hypothetical protein [Streptomyces sp. RK75]